MELGLNFSREEIATFSKHKFKEMIKNHSKELTFAILTEEKGKHSKLSNLHYSKFQTQSYLTNKDIPMTNKIEVFKFRTRMSNFSKNYGSTDPCPACRKHVDSQEELMNCSQVVENFENLHLLRNLYEEEVDPEAAKLITDIVRFREKFL